MDNASGPLLASMGMHPHDLRCSQKTNRLFLLSSTIIIVNLFRSTGRERFFSVSKMEVSFLKIRVNQKVEPVKGRLVNPIFPPIMETSCLEIAVPSPVPPYLLVVDPSAWEKLSNILSCFSFGIPIPVSWTQNRNLTSWPRSLKESAQINISPSWVNFKAFPVRLIRICLNLPGSPMSFSWASGGRKEINSNPFFWAVIANVEDKSSNNDLKLKGILSSSSLPASILEKSRMLLITASRASASLLIVVARFFWLSSSPVSRINSVIPIIPFMGVRISWLIFAKNSLFAFVAFSASVFAFSSCFSASFRSEIFVMIPSMPRGLPCLSE